MTLILIFMAEGNGNEKGMVYFERIPSDDEHQATSANSASSYVIDWFTRLFKTTKVSSIVSPIDSTKIESASTDNCAEESQQTARHESISSPSKIQKPENEFPDSRKSSTLSPVLNSPKQRVTDYNESDFRRYWMPDSSGKECYECHEKFTVFRRRHHCRLCGQIFCSKCCYYQIPGILLGYSGDLRLCAYCAQIVVSRLPQFKTIMDSEKQESFVIRNKTGIMAVSNDQTLWSCGSLSNGRSSVYTAESSKYLKSTPAMLSVVDLAYAEQTLAPSSSVSDFEQSSNIDEHEPDWVKSIEMTSVANQTDTFQNKVDEVGSAKAPRSESTLWNGISFESAKTESDAVFTTFKPELDTEEIGFETDIGRAFDERALKILRYLFDREMLDVSRWWDLIWSLCHKVSSAVRVDIEGRNDYMNIQNYIHIKTLCVDEVKPTAMVIDGVACSKCVVHREMPCKVTNAAVQILEGSIEYERVNEKLSSIDQIILQESEYLSKQVQRLVANRPSIVLVENTVTRLAVEMMHKMGLTLVCNIKKSVLLRVARCTQTDIMSSLDAQMLNQKIGFCPLFRQETVQLLDGTFKNLIIFSECPPDLGCSILLRAKSRHDLRIAKRIIRFGTLMLYTNRLENALLSAFGTTLNTRFTNCSVCQLNCNEEDPEPGSFYSHLKGSTLSTSPLIEFGVPFLETRKGKCCALRSYFKNHLYRYSETSELKEAKEALRRKEMEEISDTKAAVRFERVDGLDYPSKLNYETDVLYRDAIAAFRAFSGLKFRKQFEAWKASRRTRAEEKKEALIQNDIFDPFIHQRIAILFGSFSSKSSNAPFFCVRPWVLQMEAYGHNDMCLGDFFRRFCFNKNYQCPSINCDIPMLDHARKMVYRNVCIEITIQNYSSCADVDLMAPDKAFNDKNSELIAWHHCPACKASSPAINFDETLCRLSLARYLDYLANGSHAACRITSFNQECQHCCFHQHERYFALNGFITSFKVKPVRPYSVTFSPMVCTIESSLFTRKFVANSRCEIEEIANSVFDSLTAQLLLLRKAADNSSYSIYYSHLRDKLQEAKERYERYIAKFDLADKLQEDVLTIRSNDAVYIQAINSIYACRYIIQNLINDWNGEVGRLFLYIRSQKKSHNNGGQASLEGISNNDANGATNLSEIDLKLTDSPFLPCFHYSLPKPIDDLSYILVKDFINCKSAPCPDIGSVVAYAMSSSEYELKLRRLRELDSDSESSVRTYMESGNCGAKDHIELDFGDEKAQYYVKVYYAERFHTLRKLLFAEGENCFLCSLSCSRSWNPQGGKSGASFYRTVDDRFVFKQMSRFEIQSFLKFAPNYFSYISTAVTENKLTTLCKVYGVFRIGFKNKSSGLTLKIDLLVMEYLFYRRNVKQVWDLKGSQRNRMASKGKRAADLVLLDENLSKDLWNNQLYIHPHSKAALSMAISNDSHFLSTQHIMDYSLLVGIDDANDELIVGIVDYMRTYTLDKKLESWVKIVAIPGAHLPTVISPEMYCTRFSDAIDTYFPVAPDQWTGLGAPLSY